MHSEGVGSVCLVCLSVCVLVPKLASRIFICAKIDIAYQTGDVDQMICGNFAINAYGVISILERYCSSALCHFSMLEPSKALKC